MANDDIRRDEIKAEKHRDEWTDWVQAQSGIDTGRATPQQARLRQQKQTELADGRHRDSLALQLLLQTQYQEAFDRVTHKISGAQTQIYETLHLVRTKIDEAERNASRTAGQRIVFKDKDGLAHAADGKPLSEEEVASIVWKPDAISQEEVQSLRRFESKLLGFDQRLVVINDQTEDIRGDVSQENLATLQGFETEIDAIRSEAATIKQSFARNDTFESKPTSAAAVPNLAL